MPQLSVVIATKNRRDSLLAALRSLAQQTDVDFETLVLDDGSTDGSPAAVAAEFPAVRVHASAQSQGYIIQRNRGVQLAAAPLVVMIDDDTTFPDPATLSQTLADFDSPRIGAVAIPFINVNTSPGQVFKAAPQREGVFVTPSYIGCAHAVRRDLFLQLGGYWEPLQHYWEESDYCLRLLNAGYVTRLGRSQPALHHETNTTRNSQRQRFYAARNTILTAWKSVPALFLLPHLAAVTVRELRLILRYGGPVTTLRGILAGYRDGLRTRLSSATRPVSGSTYHLLRHLKRQPGTPLDEIAGQLPGIAAQAETGGSTGADRGLPPRG